MDTRKKSDPDTILLLGAGKMQEPAIRAAHALGYRVHAVDGNTDAPGIPLADAFSPVDLKDRPGIVDLARILRKKGALAAVFTAATDFSANVAAAAEECGLPGHSLAACENATDKLLMRSCFERAHVPSPVFYEWDSNHETMHAVFARIERLIFGDVLGNVAHPDRAIVTPMRLPLVVKPVDNMGARGCRLVRTTSEIPSALEQAVKASRAGRVIIENYMDGPEYSVDALLYDNTLTICGFADRHVRFPPYFIEMGHTLPGNLKKADYAALVKTFALAAASLGLSHGAVKGDIKLTSAGPMIGEIAGRLSGGFMSGWTFPYASGFDLTTAALHIALGHTPADLEKVRTLLPITVSNPAQGAPAYTVFEITPSKTSAERAWISVPGTIAEVIGDDDAAAVPSVTDVFPRSGPEDDAVFPRNNVQKCGNVIAVAPTRGVAMAAAQKAVSKITVVLAPRTAATDTFLARRFTMDELDFPPDAYPISDEAHLQFQTLSNIDANGSAKKAIPEFLRFALTTPDWNGVTLADALARFDRLRPSHGVLNGPAFWNACTRAGLQGMLYIADSAEAGGT